MLTTSKPTIRKRRGRKPAAALSNPDFPYTMRLPDGRTLLVEIPGRWVTADRDGTPAFLPEGAALLDRIRALATSAVTPGRPSPGYITRLREGLGMTQAQFGERIGVDKLTVSRWERGEFRPNAEKVRTIEKLRKESIRRGVMLES